jgi:hypothetical protein
MWGNYLKGEVSLRNLTFAVSLVMFAWLVWYFYTGYGGPRELATRLVPIALLLQVLFLYQQDYLYKKLPALVNHALIVFYAAICVYAFVYFYLYF